MAHEILTPAEMAAADRQTIESRLFDGYALMCRAGAAIAAEILARFGDRSRADILCGPGNNGGDGYVLGRLLHEGGFAVRLFADGPPRKGSDAERALADCPLAPLPLDEFRAGEGIILVDALYGAGFRGRLEGAAARAWEHRAAPGLVRVAVDLPSGVDGTTGAGERAFEADLTVTFARLKPGHLFYPGRALCGEVVVADIGIPDTAIRCDPPTWVNGPALWRAAMPWPGVDAHKYSRGHCAVLGGGPATGGAARLAAAAAARVGAGAVTMLVPTVALAINAARLDAIMLAGLDEAVELDGMLDRRKVASAIVGPGFGLAARESDLLTALIASGRCPLVLDADALTLMARDPEGRFAAMKTAGQAIVMTPHEGEFRRLFPDLVTTPISKLDRAREAAARAGAVIVYKGPDTVVAAPDGRATINANGSPFLATAGSGDVLAGLVGGLLAQDMPTFEAACAAVWMHAEVARLFGPGLVAEDLPRLTPSILRELYPSTP